MNYFISFLVPLLYFLLANGFFVYFTKKPFGKCLPFTFMIAAFDLFFSQVLFHTFLIGFIINYLFVVLFIILFVYSIYKKKNFNWFFDNYFSSGFYSFITIYICIYIYDFKRSFIQWDEFSHWGVMVKEMLRNDKFYSVSVSTLIAHKDYPPIMQLLEMFYTKLSGGYNESSLIKCLHLFQFSLFIPFFSDIKNITNKRNKIMLCLKSVIILLSCMLILLLFDQHGVINSIYTDYVMAIVTAYLLGFCVINKSSYENWDLIFLCIGLSFLVFIKQMAITLYLMILFLYFINLTIQKNTNFKNFKSLFNLQRFLNFIKIFSLLVIIPTMLWFGWNKYVEKLNVEQQFKLSDLKIANLSGIVHGVSGEDYQITAAANYKNAIISFNMMNSIVNISYFQCIVCILIFLVLFYLLDKNINKKVLGLIGITLIIGAVGYAFVMLVLYVFSFGDYEGPILASFNRYLPTYLILCFSLIYMLFLYINNKNNRFIYLFLICCCLFLVQSPGNFLKFQPVLSQRPKTIFEHHAINIMDKVPNNSKVYIISQNSSGEYQYFVKYYMDTNVTNVKYYNLPVIDIDDYHEYFSKNINDYMLKYDYLYLAVINDDFKEKYSFLFNCEINGGEIFKIVNNNGLVLLELVS